MSHPPFDLAPFLGRFHPLLVHLPIGFILLLGILEVISRLGPRFKTVSAATPVVALLAVPVAAVSALCGWLLSWSGGYDADLLAWHKWTGVAVAVGILLTSLTLWRGWTRAYQSLLAITVIVLMMAGHYGGSLTHGRDYLARYAPGPLRGLLGGTPIAPPAAPADPATQPVFVVGVKPIFQEHCLACHSPEKAKGQLRLDTIENIRKGGESGPVLEPGKASASSMVKRLLLPLEHEDHMPPQGKEQPSADDLALLQWWIDAGAPADKKASELNPPKNIQAILQKRTGGMTLAGPATNQAAPPPPVPKSLGEIMPVADGLAQDLGISITPLAPTEPWLQANASLAATNFGDTQLARLSPLRNNLVWLDLAGTRVTDTGLVQVAEMPFLKRLHLERTALTDAALCQLSGLKQLEYLNLYGTPVTDACLDHLKPLSKLRQLYLWQTKVTPDGVKAFGDAVVDKAQIQRWQDEIAALQARIRSEQHTIDLGLPMTTTNAVAAKPINSKCPVTGKDVDPSKTSVYEGKTVAFCCDNCKAAFDKDPKPHLAKLDLAPPPAETKKPSAP
jgi:uncharacterized membrane protein/YHS domain-containing protein